MYKSKKKPKKESPALKFIREMREKQWEQICGNKNHNRGIKDHNK
jgi:hypothetical protein